MEPSFPDRGWTWATLVISSITIVAVVFAAWELLEYRFFQHLDYVTLHYLYITRGIASSLLLAGWAAWYVVGKRRRHEEELRRSRERYRGLLEASPAAVVLYDASLQVMEWNATAEQLYGFSKAEVIGGRLPTLPPGKEAELLEFLSRIEAGEGIPEVETLRCDRQGQSLEVQLSLLPFRETSGHPFFLEVATDIRERLRLRQTMLDVERLTTMGRMAAGTAHHLNTPLAAMLLRVQMMQGQSGSERGTPDLERLETGIRFCQHFVQRLLDFSHPAPLTKQPEEIARTITSVVSFLAPSLLAKRAQVELDLKALNGARILADHNHLESLFLILLSNSLDAIAPAGTIAVQGSSPASEWIEVRIADNGCGIAPADLPRVFEPFFTTKEPGKGTGLGLAMAQQIVREHGGSVRLESTPPQGTTAFVRLRLCAGTGSGQ